MGRHTPGPWKAVTDLRTTARVEHGEGEFLATLGNSDHPISQINADAVLIAAAPDLLEACKKTLPWMGKALAEKVFEGCINPHLAEVANDLMLQAVAKAEGNQSKAKERIENAK